MGFCGFPRRDQIRIVPLGHCRRPEQNPADKRDPKMREFLRADCASRKCRTNPQAVLFDRIHGSPNDPRVLDGRSERIAFSKVRQERNTPSWSIPFFEGAGHGQSSEEITNFITITPSPLPAKRFIFWAMFGGVVDLRKSHSRPDSDHKPTSDHAHRRERAVDPLDFGGPSGAGVSP